MSHSFPPRRSSHRAAAEHDGQCPFAGSTEQLLGELGAARRDAQAETAASIAAQLREITYCAISVDDEFEIEQRKAAAACERSGKAGVRQEIGRASCRERGCQQV